MYKYDEISEDFIFTRLVKLVFEKRKAISEHTEQKINFSLCLCASVLKTTGFNCFFRLKLR